jgi:hypothetical protein
MAHDASDTSSLRDRDRGAAAMLVGGGRTSQTDSSDGRERRAGYYQKAVFATGA